MLGRHLRSRILGHHRRLPRTMRQMREEAHLPRITKHQQPKGFVRTMSNESMTGRTPVGREDLGNPLNASPPKNRPRKAGRRYGVGGRGTAAPLCTTGKEMQNHFFLLPQREKSTIKKEKDTQTRVSLTELRIYTLSSMNLKQSSKSHKPQQIEQQENN